MVKETKTEVVKKDTILTFKKDFDTVFVCETKYKDIHHYDTIHIKDKITNVEKVYIQDSIKKYFWTFSDLPYKAKYSSEYVDPIKNYKTREERITDSIKISKMLEGLTNISKNNKH